MRPLILALILSLPIQAQAKCQKEYKTSSNFAIIQSVCLAGTSVGMGFASVYIDGVNRTITTSCLSGFQALISGGSAVFSLAKGYISRHDRRVMRLLSEADHFHVTGNLDQTTEAERAFLTFAEDEGPKDIKELLNLLHFGNMKDIFCPITNYHNRLQARQTLPFGTIRQMIVDGSLKKMYDDWLELKTRRLSRQLNLPPLLVSPSPEPVIMPDPEIVTEDVRWHAD